MVGKVVPGLGVPLSVEGRVVLYGVVGVAVGDIVADGDAEVVGVIVTEGIFVGEGVIDGEIFGAGVTVWPEGVAVNEGKSLAPVAKILKDRVASLMNPWLSV